MRHRKKKAMSIKGKIQKPKNIIRNLLTSLVKHGQIKTTKKNAKVLKSYGDKFFAKLVKMFEKYEDQSDVRREVIREVKKVVFTKEEGKKIVDEIVPRYKKEDKKSGFISDYKLGYRKGDGGEEVLVKLL